MVTGMGHWEVPPRVTTDHRVIENCKLSRYGMPLDSLAKGLLLYSCGFWALFSRLVMLLDGILRLNSVEDPLLKTLCSHLACCIPTVDMR